MRITFCTLGCKANQADSGSLAEALRRRGHEFVPENAPCEAVIVNTCAVTAVAEKKSRGAIRALRRAHPDAAIVICGCLPAAAGLSAFPGADLFGDARQPEELAGRLESLVSSRPAPVLPSDGRTLSAPAERTRAFLKIQDGCQNACSYCVIPRARGPARSLPLSEALAQARSLAQQGFPELVLTGIEISSYAEGLESLVNALSEALPDTRLRLGSLEPTCVTESFVSTLARAKTLCPHFHVSLQSGSDRILRLMNRKYDTERFMEALDTLRHYFPNAALTTDLICGFPGETDDDHAETLKLIRRANFSDMHIFPYSSRPGTPASLMPGQLTLAQKKRRAAEVAAVASEMTEAYLTAQLGRVLHVLFETENDGQCTGHSENYLTVSTAASELKSRTFPVRITESSGGSLTGILLQN